MAAARPTAIHPDNAPFTMDAKARAFIRRPSNICRGPGVGRPSLIHSLNAGCEFQINKASCKSRAVTTGCEGVELSSISARYVDWPGAIAPGCERMVHPSVLGQEERERQRRFIGVMLAVPF